MPRTSRCRPPGRRLPPTCWRRNISARRGCPRGSRRSRKRPFRPGCGARAPTRRHWRRCRRRSAAPASIPPSRCSSGSPAPGPIGAGRAAISIRKHTRAFFDELVYMLAMQMAAPNSPQWFNTGLYWAYGIDGPSQGHFYVDFKTGKLVKSKSAYEHPQPHACFIQSIADDLVNEGGIMDLWVREARLFKYGSGTGSNFSRLRGEGERLAGGGKSSGLMSFLKIGDRAAGAIKSGGTTRRAAKMVIVDADHPDIEQFI